MLGSGYPVLVLKEGTTRESGRSAQEKNIMVAQAIAEAVRTTLGPKGADKMLVDSLGDVVITNDGATILKELDVEHPTAKMLIEVAKAQDEECKDGTVTSVVLAAELLKRAGELMNQKIHPTVIVDGYRMAAEKAVEVLKNIAREVKPEDAEALKKVATTAMTGKISDSFKDYLAELAVNAVRRVAEEKDGRIRVDIDNIKVEKKHGGSIKDSRIVEGVILDKEVVHPGMPKEVKDAKILLLNQGLEVKKTEFDATIRITSPEQLQAFLNEEEKMLKDMVEKIKASGAKVVLCQKGIDDMAQHFLAKAGIYAVRRVKKSDMEKLAKATGGKIVNNIKEFTSEDLGKAERVYQEKVGDENMTFVEGCPGARSVSVLLRGGSEHVVEELERSFHDAIGVVGVALEDGYVTPGGGAAAVEIARELRKYAVDVGGRQQMAIEAFADAVEIVPKTLAENAGLDPIDTLIELRDAHKDEKGKWMGLNVMNGKIEDMWKLNVLEPLRVGRQAILGATEAAGMILRIDDIIAAKKGESKGGEEGGKSGDEEE